MSTQQQALVPAPQAQQELVRVHAGEDTTSQDFSAFSNIVQFSQAQRMALLLCNSQIIPKQFQGEEHMCDCVIAIELANRIGASVLAVMQNLDVIYGRPSWRAQFLISCLNASRRFSPLRYELSEPGPEETVTYSFNRYDPSGNKTRAEGTMKIRNQTCVAWAYEKATGENLRGPEVSIRMAVEEGWYTKDGSKWKTMAQLMLSYRAAAFFTRVYAPELTMGIQTAEEVRDTIDIEPAPKDTPRTISPEFGAVGEGGRNNSAGPAQTPAPTTAPAASSPTNFYESEQGKVAEFLEDAGVTFSKFRGWASETGRLADADSYGSWSELPSAFCVELRKDVKSLNKCIVRCKS